VLEDLIKVVIDLEHEITEMKQGMYCGLFYLAYVGDYVLCTFIKCDVFFNNKIENMRKKI